MRILFITWETFPFKSATSNCLMAIIRELNKQNIETDILNITGAYSLAKEVSYENIKIINIFIDQYASVRQLIKKKTMLAVRVIAKRILSRFFKLNHNGGLSKKDINTVLSTLEKNGAEYDVFIAVCSNVVNGIICDKYCMKKGKKFLLYQVDPIETNMVYSDKMLMKKIELQLYKNANSIITTPILAEEKRNEPQYTQYLHKIYAVEFPNVQDLTVNTDRTDKERNITCYYTGRFYSGVRDCKYALEVLRTIDNLDFDIVFAGDGQEEEINYYKNTYFGNRIKHLGMIDLSESFKMMQAADVLINIGNNVTNQVPSKLFDYISTGKPIINFCKNSNCPTIPYMNRYRLGINIIEGEDSIEKQGEKVSQFIRDCYGKRLDYNEIKETFIENTPEYVCNIFIKALENIGK